MPETSRASRRFSTNLKTIISHSDWFDQNKDLPVWQVFSYALKCDIMIWLPLPILVQGGGGTVGFYDDIIHSFCCGRCGILLHMQMAGWKDETVTSLGVLHRYNLYM